MKNTNAYKKWIIPILLIALFVTLTSCTGNISGTIRFYSEPTEEFADPISYVSIDLSAKQIRQLKRIIKAANDWFDDYTVNRLPFVFNGEFEFSDTESVYLFSYKSNVIYYDHYYAEIPEKSMQLIKDISTNNK